MKIGGAKFRRMSKRRQKIQLKKQVKGVLMQFAGRKYEPSLQVEMVAALRGILPPLPPPPPPPVQFRISTPQGLDQVFTV